MTPLPGAAPFASFPAPAPQTAVKTPQQGTTSAPTPPAAAAPTVDPEVEFDKLKTQGNKHVQKVRHCNTYLDGVTQKGP